MNEQYYLNNNIIHQCVRVPPKIHDYFLILNYLSELKTEEEKELARLNLGITVLLELLHTLISTQVIRVGANEWDLEPHEGDSYKTKVLSSDALYNAFSKYYTKEQIDKALLEINRAIEGKVDIDVDIITELPAETIIYNQLVTYRGVPAQPVQWLDNYNVIHTTYITLDGYYDYTYDPEDDRKLIFNSIYYLGNLPHNLIAALSGIVDIKSYLDEGSILPKSSAYVYQGLPLEVYRINSDLINFDESENIVGFVAFIIRRKTSLENILPNIYIYKVELNLSNNILDVNLIYYKTITNQSTLDDFDKELIELLGCTKATHDYGGLITAEDKTNLDYLSENSITKVELSSIKNQLLQILPDRPATYTHNNVPVEYRTYTTINDGIELHWYVFLISTNPLNPICLGYCSTEPFIDYYCQGYFNKDESSGMNIIPDWMYSLFHQDTSVQVSNIFTEEFNLEEELHYDEYDYATDQDIEQLFE